MRYRSLLLLFVFIPVLSFAQRGGYPQGGGYQMQNESSILSIFSENGEPFFLVLNGVKQNMNPQTKIRVEALPQYVNDVQIMFADGSQPVRKKVVVSDPLDGRAVNLTLKVSKSNGRGYPRLRFHRMTECDRNYHGPRDEYVMYYGKPQQINTVTETTYTDPITGQWVTQTTTTTTNDNNYNNNGYNNNGGYNNNNNGYNNNGGYNNNNNHNTPPPPPAPVPMDERTFSDVKRSISGSSFDETRLSTAKTILNSNYVSTNQVMELCKLFSFEDSRLKFAEYAYSRTVDQGNYFKVANVFSFDANKTALNDYINNNRR